MSEKTYEICFIDDDLNDTAHVTELLQSLDFRYHLTTASSLNDAARLFDNKPNIYDLILMDLEFRLENTTSLYFLQDISISCPVIILSHLRHFQRMSFPNMNVYTFISKEQMGSTLLPAIRQCLTGPIMSRPQEALIFPPLHQGEPSERVYIREILHIYKSSRRTFGVAKKDGSVITIGSSIDMNTLYSTIQSRRIHDLIRVSRSNIINLAYMSSVKKLRNGRVELHLLDYQDSIIVGREYLKELEIFLPLPK